MPNSIKNPAEFLRETGLLFEINRQVLHPLGLALGVVTSKEGAEESSVGEFTLYDAREDDEGYVYDGETFIDALERFNKYMIQTGVAQLSKRKATLGYVVQELADPHIKKNGVVLFTYNPDYDDEDENSHDLLAYRVPYEWAEEFLEEHYDQTVAEFLDTYTYDNTEYLLMMAEEEGVVFQKETLRDAR